MLSMAQNTQQTASICSQHCCMASLRMCSAAGRSASDEANEFKPPPQMQEIVISFLTRMAFLLGDATKEPEFMVNPKP